MERDVNPEYVKRDDSDDEYDEVSFIFEPWVLYVYPCYVQYMLQPKESMKS